MTNADRKLQTYSTFVYFCFPTSLTLENVQGFLDGNQRPRYASGELRCCEYCFQCCLNLFQHPSVDDNLYHLDALIAASTQQLLWRTCNFNYS